MLLLIACGNQESAEPQQSETMTRSVAPEDIRAIAKAEALDGNWKQPWMKRVD